MIQIFNSRDTNYRSPFGACKEGTEIHFKICLPRHLGCHNLNLNIKTSKIYHDSHEESFSFSMFWAGMNGDDHEWWECHYTPEKIGVYWYWFELDANNGKSFLWKTDNSVAERSEKPSGRSWQLTCYSRDLKTPKWLSGGIMYQIFPDRFCNSGKKMPEIKGREIREHWGEPPVWRPDGDGKVKNNDFFGGDLKGIESRLGYLHGLGVTCIYVNPIFEAQSTHRYDTSNYEQIDPFLGDESDFNSLIKSAGELGIKIMLDGVFSHTGSDSVYFNSEGRYDTLGAYQSKDSPYFRWYTFEQWPNQYKAWWGFQTLPEVNEQDRSFRNYIVGENGIVRKRISDGVGGWRLDVADELPDDFIDELFRAAKAENPESVVIGEVWEDATNKHGFGLNRRYLLGGQLDSVMNYPFRSAILDFLSKSPLEGDHYRRSANSGQVFFNCVMEVIENYPPEVIRLLMNHIGTHDTPRAITMLAGELLSERGREWQNMQKLSSDQWECGIQLMKLAAFMQYTLPGVPCVYYGDEVGMEGYRDPFNRFCYPYGSENAELLGWYRRLGQFRKSSKIFTNGIFVPVYGAENVVVYERQSELHEDGGCGRVLCAVNASDSTVCVNVDDSFWDNHTICLGAAEFNSANNLMLPPFSCAACIDTEMID